MQKVGGIWSPIIFRRILFEGADVDRQTEGYLKVGGIWSHKIFFRILFQGADADKTFTAYGMYVKKCFDHGYHSHKNLTKNLQHQHK